MDIDTLLFAFLAVILLARLWFIFGRRNETDEPRPNPFLLPADTRDDPQILPAAPAQPGAKEERPPPKPAGSPPGSLAAGLESVAALIPSFDERAFLQNARGIFTSVVEDFGKGDLTRSRSLLGPHVLPHFENAIEQRKQAGQSMESRIAQIKDAEAAMAHVDGKIAYITVRFVSQQENILRGMDGKVIGGGPGRIEEITDLWTFMYDTQATDIRWVVAETHS